MRIFFSSNEVFLQTHLKKQNTPLFVMSSKKENYWSKQSTLFSFSITFLPEKKLPF